MTTLNLMFLQAPLAPEIRLTNLFEEGMFLDEAQKKPAMKKFDHFLLERLLDPKFFTHSGTKEGVDAVELSMRARAAVKAGAQNGWYVFDAEVGERLKECALKPTAGYGYDPGLMHNYAEWLGLFKAMSTKDPRVALADPPIAEG